MKEFEKWVEKAENDLQVIINNLAAGKIPIDACCFHAQGRRMKMTIVKELGIFIVPAAHLVDRI